MRIAGVGGVAFAVVLLVLVLVPRQATRNAARLDAAAGQPDTAALAARLAAAEGALAASEVALSGQRAELRARQVRAAAQDSAAGAAPRTRRDSLAASLAELSRLLARSDRSPLPASYRALGSAAALRGNPRVQTLLDSLGDVERARTAFDAAGGVDPIFVALTSRVNALGRSLQALAAAARDSVRTALAALGGPPPAAGPATAPGLDTMPSLARVDSAQRSVTRASEALDSGRAITAAIDARRARARAVATDTASPMATVAASLVLALAVGFAVTLGLELRTPRVADAAEAERVMGVPALATVALQPPDPHRARRRADRALSPLIDSGSPGYQYAYARVREDLTQAALAVPLIAVVGDHAGIVATVATNIAVAGVRDARSVLLVDGDPEAAMIASIVRVPAAPGVSDVLAGRADWPAAIKSAAVGRDHTVDVIPAGSLEQDGTGSPPAADGEAIRSELYRLARRYELVVLVAPAGAVRVGPASVLPVSDAIVCARLAHTPIARLGESVVALRESGVRVRGVVLWERPIPHAATSEATVGGVGAGG